MNKKATIDYSAFLDKDGNELIKEVTVVDIDTKCEQHWIFKCPTEIFSWGGGGPPKVVKYNAWTSNHFHGLDLVYGFSEHEQLLSSLESVCSEMQLLFAADAAKARGLEKLFQYKRVVFSLGSLGCPTMDRTPTKPLPSKKEDCTVGEDCVDGDQEVPESQTLVVTNRRPCLYHSLHAPHFFCTRSAAHYLADWCAENPHLLDMNDPRVREKTFVGWKLNKPSARELAELGFVRTASYGDNTKCMYCGLVLHQWQEGDDAEEDHYYNAQFCKFHRYQMQLMCEKEEKEKMENPKGGYLKYRCGATNREAPNSDGLFEERDAFYLRYGRVSDLTWDDVKALCSG